MSLIGNPNLCGPQAFGLLACPTIKYHFFVCEKGTTSSEWGWSYCVYIVFLTSRILLERKYACEKF